MTQSNLALTENQVIPEGYKKTEIGIIPEDWIVEPLEKFTTFISYGFTNPMPTTVKGPYMLTAKDINGGKIQYREARQTSIDAFNKLLTSKSKPIKNDLLLTKDGTLGRLALVEDEPVCINQSVAVLRPNQRIVPNFFQLLLESEYYQDQMLENAGGSTIKHIYITVVNKMLLGLPQSLVEQQKIAIALSDTDALISELEKLIEKKQAIKTATMQQLLTGKTRLPEFALREDDTPKASKDSELGQIPEDWEVKKLGELVEITSGESPSKFNFVNDGIPYFKVEQLNNGNFYAESTPYSVKLGKTILAGSLIFPKRGASILSNKIRILKVNACMDTNLMALTCSHELNPNYLLYSLSYSGLDKVADTTSIPQINNKHILPYKIFYPSVSEQIRISSILVDLENDIELSQQKIEKLRKIKLGMMQELLTGKTRLV